ncbi:MULTISPECIES: DUF4209 domain-containing protein, partial [Lysobacteraceae]
PGPAEGPPPARPALSLLSVPFEPGLLSALGWEDGLADLDWSGTDWDLAQQIAQRARQAQQNGLTTASALLQFVARISSMSLQVGGTTLFMPRIITPDGTSAGLDHISANDLQALLALARQAPTDWLTARCADLALATNRITGRDIQQLAALGARSYLRLAQHAAAEDITPQAIDHLRRALDLGWRGLRKDEGFHAELWVTFMAMFQSVLDGPMKGLANRFADELLRRADAEHTQAAAASLEAAAAAIDPSVDIDSELTHLLFQLASRLWLSLNLVERSRQAGRQAGESLVVRAGRATSAMVASYWMAQGIAELRQNHAPRERIRELQRELEDVRLRINDEMGEISTPVDARPIHAWVDEHLATTDYPTSLMRIAFSFTDYSDFTTEVEHAKALKAEYFNGLFGSTELDADGVPLRSHPPFDPKNPEHLETAAIEGVCQTRYTFLLAPFILSSVRKLSERFSSSFNDVLSFVGRSPGAPDGHHKQIARGLVAGLQHEWDTAGINLLPMIEPMVRAQLKAHGVNTLVSNKVNGEQERSLSELLELDDEAGILPRGLNFELRALMTHRAGCNLRNRYAHGLLSDQQLGTFPIVITWWVVLRMVLDPYR